MNAETLNLLFSVFEQAESGTFVGYMLAITTLIMALTAWLKTKMGLRLMHKLPRHWWPAVPGVLGLAVAIVGGFGAGFSVKMVVLLALTGPAASYLYDFVRGIMKASNARAIDEDWGKRGVIEPTPEELRADLKGANEVRTFLGAKWSETTLDAVKRVRYQRNKRFNEAIAGLRKELAGSETTRALKKAVSIVSEWESDDEYAVREGESAEIRAESDEDKSKRIVSAETEAWDDYEGKGDA